jgi:AcrR family transcriptional regulator
MVISGRKSDTRKRLIEAALRVVSEKGYLGATTKEMAKAAGVTELTLFRHFGSKEVLFGDVLNTYAFLPTLKELSVKLGGCTYEEALTEIGIKFFLHLKEKKSLVRIMLQDMGVFPQRIRLLHAGMIEKLIETLSEHLSFLKEKGMLRDVEPDVASRAFFGMVFSYFMAEEILKGRKTAKAEIKKTIRQFVDIFVRGTKKHKTLAMEVRNV